MDEKGNVSSITGSRLVSNGLLFCDFFFMLILLHFYTILCHVWIDDRSSLTMQNCFDWIIWLVCKSGTWPFYYAALIRSDKKKTTKNVIKNLLNKNVSINLLIWCLNYDCFWIVQNGERLTSDFHRKIISNVLYCLWNTHTILESPLDVSRLLKKHILIVRNLFYCFYREIKGFQANFIAFLIIVFYTAFDFFYNWVF